MERDLYKRALSLAAGVEHCGCSVLGHPAAGEVRDCQRGKVRSGGPEDRTSE